MGLGKVETCAHCGKQFKALLDKHDEQDCIDGLREENARLRQRAEELERDIVRMVQKGAANLERAESAEAKVARLEGLISAVDMDAGHSVYAEHWQAFQAEARRIRAAKGK